MPNSSSPDNSAPMPVMPAEQLRGFERVSVPLLEATNSRPFVRRALHATVGWFFSYVVRGVTGPRWKVFGLESLKAVNAPDGIILAANHRSFFDLFVVSTAVKHGTPHMHEVAYPVRSNFFYTHPLGPVVNLIAAGATMWPPVFRDERRRVLNPIGFAQLSSTLSRGCVIGIHPEGTRSKLEDPYTYLPRKPGLGQLIAACKPGVLVVPVFVCGLSNKVGIEVHRSYGKGGRNVEPIRMWLGEPIRADAIQPLGDAGAMTEAVFDRVRALGEADRTWMASQKR